MTDVLVIGSGPGGVNAAAPLVAAGLQVVMLDYGNTDTRYARLIPSRDFSDIRHTDPEQHRFFLGDRFEGIPFGPVKVGAQLTPPRMHILADAAQRIPVDSPEFAVSISLARGGLGAGWSAGVFPFTDDELRDTGIGAAEMQPHYDAVAARIGVAGDRDDLLPFLPDSPSLMPALDVDTGAETLLARYAGKRKVLNAEGFFLGRTRLAVCTREYRDRGPEAYRDMAYWADLDRSIYRPQWTLEELRRAPNFTYLDRRFVETFAEADGEVRVHTTHADSGAVETHTGRALVMAAGTIGSTRLVLRSLGRYDTPVPILCNPYSYVPTVNLGTLGRPVRDRRHSLAQLTAMIRVEGARPRLLQAQVFSYRSLLTFKLMKESPLACPRSLAVMRLLMPHMAILGINHEDRPAPDKTCTLRRGTPDRLEVRYRPIAEETRTQRADERCVLRFFRRLGCLPLKTVRPGEGASLHYAGAFPLRPDGGDLTCDRDGRLRATRAVYLADGSVFPWIPPKGLTFNIMANADRVGTLLARRLA
jgi:hypothetical protein